MTTFDITDDHTGKRIDVCLADSFVGTHSRGEIVKAIKAGTVLLGGKVVKPSHKLKTGDVVTMEVIEKEVEALLPNDTIDLDIIEETDDFIVINKPRGIQVHPSSVEKKATIANALVAHYPAMASVGDSDPDNPDAPQMRPGIMSRLDKYTSGLMVVAKNQKTFDALKKEFADRKVTKVYHALVWGEPKELDGTIDMPIGRAVGYTKQKVAFGKFTDGAKEAVTDYKTLSTHGVSDLLKIKNPGDKEVTISHLEVRPHTGRMHQIRVHLAHIGRGIIGDIKYERKNEKLLNKKLFAFLPEDDFTTFYLHAKELSFALDGEKHEYESLLPDHLTYLLEQF